MLHEEINPFIEEEFDTSHRRLIRRRNRTKGLIGVAICCSLSIIAASFVFVLVKAKVSHDFHPKNPIAETIQSIMNRSADPCTDFYSFACGNWLQNTSIPKDSAIISRGRQLAERNREILLQILEERSDPLLATFYDTCLDIQTINSTGVDPLLHFINELKIDTQITSSKDFMKLIGVIQNSNIPVFFNLPVYTDRLDPIVNIAYLEQAGIALPSKELYLKEEILQKYKEHIQKMLSMALSIPEEEATEMAEDVLIMEKEIANISWDAVDAYSPVKSFHKYSLSQFYAQNSKLPWSAMIHASYLPDNISYINVGQPDFFSNLTSYLSDVLTSKPNQIKSYLKWQIIHFSAPFLSSNLVTEDFNFFKKTLQGQQQEKPRDRLCLEYLESTRLGMLLGKYFVAKSFSNEAKQKVTQIFKDIRDAFIQNLEDVSWLDNPTKDYATKKAKAMNYSIGYPDTWEDFSGISIQKKSFFEIIIILNQFEQRNMMQSAGKPVNKDYWFLPPQAVNAFNKRSPNELVILAGISQPPFFDVSFPKELNYGGIGEVCGHELTHGFDNSGRFFDKKGAIKNWWSNSSLEGFRNASQCVVDQYSQYKVQPGLFLNGKLTLGENIADNGGLKEAFTAYRNKVNEEQGSRESIVSKITRDQLFFLQFGQTYCSKETPEYQRLAVKIDPHSIQKFRVIGTISNFEEFSKAFQCKQGTPYNRSNKCKVW